MNKPTQYSQGHSVDPVELRVESPPRNSTQHLHSRHPLRPQQTPQDQLNQRPAVHPLHQAQANTGRLEDRDRGLDFITVERGEHEYAAAIKHSSKVKFLKIAFPVVGLLIILGISGALLVNSVLVPEAEVASVELDNGNLVMENPQLNGFDKNQRPFSLTAARAIQDVANPTRIELETISANLPVDEIVSANIQAGNGIYDAELKTLVLKQSINVETSDGLKLSLDDADINIGEGTLKTSGAVTATSPQADIYAESVSVSDNGNRVKFSGNVRITMRPKELQEASD